MTSATTRPTITICLHFSLEHYRGGEKWAAAIANRLHRDGLPVQVRSLPYAPNGVRRTSYRSVLDPGIPYRESWLHDLSATDRAYLVYAPGMRHLFRNATTTIAGIHSWAFVSPGLVESHYSPLHNAVKLAYGLVGSADLERYDRVHTVTPAFDPGNGIDPVYVPNFVDRQRFRPDRTSRFDRFTVLVTAAHVPEKGWDLVRRTAAQLDPEIRVVTTGTSDAPTVEGLGYLDEDELADAYARSHVVLHPARVDTDSMVINEACASGTPVVTTPIRTHIRRNEAVLHAATPPEMVDRITTLRDEWQAGSRYERRCRIARRTSASRDVEQVYPALKSVIAGSDGSVVSLWRDSEYVSDAVNHQQ